MKHPQRRKSLLGALFLGVGLLLFGMVIAQTGWQTVLRSFHEVGLNYVWVLLWPLSYLWASTLAWRETIPKGARTMPVGKLFRARLLGEAVNYLTPLGTMGGDPARALWIKGQMEGAAGNASIVLDRTIYFLATVVFVVLGTLVGLWTLPLSASLRLACWVTMTCFVVLFCILVFMQHLGAATKIARLARRWPGLARVAEKVLPNLERTEQIIHDFYRRQPRSFLRSTALHILGRAAGTLEIFFMLYFLGAFATDSPWGFAADPRLTGVGWAPILYALLIATFAIVVNFAFFMFPTQIGVAEGANAVLFQLLGLNPALGVALQLVKRVKSISYAGLGLLLSRSRGAKAVHRAS